MEMNFFGWLRQGVRRAVLMGVSDAVETIGEPSENSSLREELQLAIGQEDDTPAATAKKTTRTRKRLGRSLQDVETVGKKDG